MLQQENDSRDRKLARKRRDEIRVNRRGTNMLSSTKNKGIKLDIATEILKACNDVPGTHSGQF